MVSIPAAEFPRINSQKPVFTNEGLESRSRPLMISLKNPQKTGPK